MAGRLPVGDGTLAVHDAGGGGAPFVVAHGVGSSARFVLDAFAGPFASAGWRLVAFDLRGHGSSDPAPTPARHRLAAVTADLVAVAEHVGARAIGGVSLGAHAAVAAAAAAPARFDTVLACLPAWTGTAVRGVGPHAAVASRVRERGLDATIDGFHTDPALPGWLREVLVRDWTRADPDSLLTALDALDGGSAPARDTLAGVAAPLGLVAWPDDPGHPLAVAREWARAAPRAYLVTLGLGDLEGDLEALGRAALAAVAGARDGA